jgi:hypothetical protein
LILFQDAFLFVFLFSLLSTFLWSQDSYVEKREFWMYFPFEFSLKKQNVFYFSALCDYFSSLDRVINILVRLTTGNLSKRDVLFSARFRRQQF